MAIVLGFSNAFAAVDVGQMGNASIPLTQHIQFLEDARAQLKLADLQSVEVKASFRSEATQIYALQFGITKSPWWLRFSLRNETDQPVERYVEIANSRLTRLDFCGPDVGMDFRCTETGSLKSFDSRPYANRYFVFPIKLAPNSVGTFYVRVESSSSLSVPARVWSPEAFRLYEKNDYLVQGLYLGAAIAIAVLNLFLFYTLREKLYLVYVGVVVSITFTVFSHNGLVKQMIAADSPAWSLSSASVGYAVAVGLLLLFMRQMLSTATVVPRADRWLRGAMWVFLLPVPVALALFHQSVILFTQFLTLSVIGLELLVGVYLCWHRQRSAYFFMLAYSWLIIVACANLLAGLDWIPLVWDVGWSAQVASGFEMILLSLALADRMNQVRLQRDHSQELAIQLQASLVEELRGSEQRLKHLVSQRVDELRRLIDMLSHEVRTPMSVIRMYLSMDQASPRSREQARQAVSDVDAIIERCLDTDQVDHASVTINRQNCRIDAVVQGLITSNLEAQRVQVSAPQPCEIHTDLQLLKVLLSNLIDNALKYSPPHAQVQVSVFPADRNNQPGVCVRVSNPVGAAGFPDLDRVFSKFYRSPSAHGKSGSGLGLYLVSQFVQLLGGTVEVQCATDQVHFDLWLPL
ncbi:sensor histidine kinase [Limnohabitans sp. Hippo3]|uniref:sensor histidine kinase n=1 Tax=Limnohabitans sp. Hippo3 TaxID=1597956 RepID=UPI001304D2DD|nr:sensor histidine kinase [Limnohabitans sp. Hippo3]